MEANRKKENNLIENNKTGEAHFMALTVWLTGAAER